MGDIYNPKKIKKITDKVGNVFLSALVIGKASFLLLKRRKESIEDEMEKVLSENVDPLLFFLKGKNEKERISKKHESDPYIVFLSIDFLQRGTSYFYFKNRYTNKPANVEISLSPL